MVRGGWHEHHRRGSHVYLRHQDKPGKQVTISVTVAVTYYRERWQRSLTRLK